MENKVGRPKGTKNKEGHKAGNPRSGFGERRKGFSVRLTEEEHEELTRMINESKGDKKVDKFLNLLGILK